MANFGKGLGAGLEALGAGMIKQGETVGNMMYLTAAADKEAARKSGAAGAKAQHDTMLKYLDRMGSDVDALSKQYVAAITAQDASAASIGERLAKAESNLTAAWDSVLGRKPKETKIKDYTKEVTAYLESYGVGDKLQLLNQDLLGDENHSGSLKKIRADYGKLHPNWDKLDEKTRTGIVNATATRIRAIKPEDIVSESETPTIQEERGPDTLTGKRPNFPMLRPPSGSTKGFSGPQGGDRLVKRDGIYYMDGNAISEQQGTKIENTLKKYHGYQYQVPEITSTVGEATTHEMGADSPISRQAFNKMMGGGSAAGGMAGDYEDDPAASAEARALARQQTQAQGAAQQGSPQDTTQQTLTQATPDDVAAIKRFMQQLLQRIESMGEAEAMQAMAQHFSSLSPSQKQILLADKKYGAAFKQLMR